MTSTEYERFRVANPHFYLAPFDLLNEQEVKSVCGVSAEKLVADMTRLSLLGSNPNHYWHAYYPVADEGAHIGVNSGRCEERGCYGKLMNDEQVRVGLCAKHLQVVKENLPE